MKVRSIDRFFVRSFHVMAVALYAVLFAVSVFITGVNREDRADEYIILEQNSAFRIILITLVFGGAMFLAGLLYDRILK